MEPSRVDAARPRPPLPRQGQRIACHAHARESEHGSHAKARKRWVPEGVKGAGVVHTLVTSCGQSGSPVERSSFTGRTFDGSATADSSHRDPREARHRPRFPRVPAKAGSSMEGTSGAAEFGLLRGRTDDAALDLGNRVTQRGPSRGWVAGGRVDTAGVSLQRGSEAMTGGARADRVGAKLSYVVPTKVGSRRKPGIRRKPCMTTVQARTTRKRERRASVNEKCLRRKPPGPWPVKPRLALVSFLYPGPRGSGRHVSHVAGSETMVTRERAARRASQGVSLVLETRGSVGSVVVLAGCLGCRSRRAALGPGCTPPR